MVRRIELMTDYFCYPLWGMDYPDMGDIDPGSLPLQRETILRLERWADVYNSILNVEDPASTDFKTEAEEADWIQEGILLWKILQQELGPEYRVYFLVPDLTHALLASPEELDTLFPGKYTKM